MIIPITYDSLFISNVPGTQVYDYNKTGVVTNMNVWAGHVSSLSGNTVAASTDFVFNGNESVQSLDRKITGGGQLYGYLFMAGNAHEPGFNDNDIYFGIAPPSLKDSTANCPVDSTTWLDSIATTPQDLNILPDQVYGDTTIETSFTQETLSSNLQCGSTLHNKQGTTSVVQDHKQDVSIVVAPNPSGGMFNVFYGIPNAFDRAEIVITDITGKIMAQQPLHSQSGVVHINLADQPAGHVICSILVDSHILESRKIVITK